jgi:hypothetical protein
MTRRMLLTLIAILTGLSWQAGGVSARAIPAPSQVSAVSALAVVQQAKASAVLARPCTKSFRVRPSTRGDAPRCLWLALAPPSGALVRIDRARE